MGLSLRMGIGLDGGLGSASIPNFSLIWTPAYLAWSGAYITWA
jgi:hypothetical protein